MGGDRIDRFISRWHRGEWSVANLPREIGARVGYFRAADAPGLLGCCHVRRGEPSVIALNASLVGSPYLIPVLAHECAHVLASRQGYHACHGERSEKFGEMPVWALAGRLCLPETARQSILSGDACCDGVARSQGLPAAFVAYATFGGPLLPAWLAELGAA